MVLGRIKRRIQLWKFRRIQKRRKRAQLRAKVARKQRERIESIHPDKETLPLGTWLKEAGRFFWTSFKYKRFPLRCLNNQCD